jgi:hypothetical protein
MICTTPFAVPTNKKLLKVLVGQGSNYKIIQKLFSNTGITH